MAIKTIGDLTGAGVTSNYIWGGSLTYANVAMAVTMPEKGYVTKLAFAVMKYDSTDNPIVYAVIWNKATGQKIVQSAARTTWQNADVVADANGPAQEVYHEFDLPRTFIDKDTQIWIGFSKVSNESGRRTAFWYFNSAGSKIYYNNDSQSSPPSTFVSSNVFGGDLYLQFQLTYETGGEVKVYNGSTNVTKPAKVFNGSQWVQKTVKIWNGSIWKDSNG